MENYREYLPELKSTTLFQDIQEDALIQLLETMQPAVIHRKKGEFPGIKNDFKTFRMILKAYPAKEPAPRPHKYDMPKFGEPGMLMAEIPSLSQCFAGPKPEDETGDRPVRKGPPLKPLSFDVDLLELSGEMMTKYYGPEVAEAQGIMLRNFLGILAQKVCDVREEKFQLIRKFDLEDKIEK